MMIDINLIFTVLAVTISIISAITSIKRGNMHDTKSDTAQLTTVIVKLENIGNDINEIKKDLRDVKADVKDHGNRIVKLEQQVKTLNKGHF